MNDNIYHPSHYCDGGIETIDFIRAKLTKEQFIGYCHGNALKYLSRSGKKGDRREDNEKAIVYLKWENETIKNETEKQHENRGITTEISETGRRKDGAQKP